MTAEHGLEEVLQVAALGMGDGNLTELTVGEVELQACRFAGYLDDLLFEKA
jgi:hypothetical protein